MRFKGLTYFLYAGGFLGLIFFATAPRQAEAAFGISPPFMNAVHLVKGAKYSQTIYLIQDQPNADLGISAAINVPAKIKTWITIDKGTDFIIPKGIQQFPVQISIAVPSETDLGSYHADITFTTKPAQAGQVTIALGAQVSLNLLVGTGIYEKFDLPIIKPMDIEEGWDPRVLVRFNNEGNIPESFTGATFELLDQYGAVRLAYVQKTDGFPETPPFMQQEYILDFPVDFHLGVGQYWANVSFYQNEKLIGSQKTVFNVLRAGSLYGPWPRLLNTVKKNPVYPIGGAFLLLGSGIYWKKRRRMK